MQFLHVESLLHQGHFYLPNEQRVIGKGGEEK